jgi:hypothetical protein
MLNTIYYSDKLESIILLSLYSNGKLAVITRATSKVTGEFNDIRNFLIKEEYQLIGAFYEN